MSHTPAVIARTAGRASLADALQDSRRRTLMLLDAYVEVLGEHLTAPCCPQFNPPLWEIGRIGWFQDFWIARNKERELGIRCDPGHPRPPGRQPDADKLYASGLGDHSTRWSLSLPDTTSTRGYLAESLAEILTILSATPENDDALYFFRLCLLREDMHAETAISMAQALGIRIPHDLIAPALALPQSNQLSITAHEWQLGHTGGGFAFDNELEAHTVAIDAFDIDSTAVTWERYLPFIEATHTELPRYLRKEGGEWQHQVFGEWFALPLEAAATHLTWREAHAWCRWSDRRLPTEAEWELAAMTHTGFYWGRTWEWTANRFLPYPEFSSHPDRSYSEPWFGDHYSVRGASRATSARLIHPRFRNFFDADNNSFAIGFRSCAL